jgi:sodium pump decarboxylase gamma subunit
MEQEHLLREGLILMVVGVTIVFAFLSLLVGVMSLSRFFQRFSFLLPDAEPSLTGPASVPQIAGDVSARIAVAIAVARTR